MPTCMQAQSSLLQRGHCHVYVVAWDSKESHFATCVSVYYKTLCVAPSSNDSNKRQSPRRVVIDFFNI